MVERKTMRPSNPATFYISGSETRVFKYDPGPNPYYVILASKSYIPLSMMVFASCEEHALDIIRQMIDFKEGCLTENRRSEKGSFDKHDLQGREYRKIHDLRMALAGEGGYTVNVDAVDTSQLHKIGWAGNDTI